MTRVDELIGDLDVAIETLRKAATPREKRMGVAAVLDHLYKLRCLREGEPGPDRDSYNLRVGAQRAGKVAEGISLLRGEMTHDVTMEIVPTDQLLYPSENLFPSENIYPGKQLIWLYLSDMVDQLDPGGPPTPELTPPKDPRRGYYAKYVAGQSVLQTAVEARNFLAADPGPPT
ncbi:hypothetical protein [Nocardia colli]|uniref:hypothetical protein n=1 Tax=Nocardia colli TaxID=2545717 RepID=UPI0035DCC9A8